MIQTSLLVQIKPLNPTTTVSELGEIWLWCTWTLSCECASSTYSETQGECWALQGKWKKALRADRVELPVLRCNPSTLNQISASDWNLLFTWGIVTNWQLKEKCEGDNVMQIQMKPPARATQCRHWLHLGPCSINTNMPTLHHASKAAQQRATSSGHRGFVYLQTAWETRAGSARACFGSGSDPTGQPPLPARQRHTRELRVISFPVVKWSKCISMQDWGPGNHEETGFLFLLQTTAAPVDCCSNASFPQRRTWSWDFTFS